MGHELFALFRAAGLPDPQMNLESTVLGGTVADGHSGADVVVGALPMIEKLGIATRQEVLDRRRSASACRPSWSPTTES